MPKVFIMLQESKVGFCISISPYLFIYDLLFLDYPRGYLIEANVDAVLTEKGQSQCVLLAHNVMIRN